MIRLQDVDFAYGSTPVLDGVRLTIQSSETLALMGANGAGKTTLLRLIAGLRDPDSGRLEHDGVVGFAPEDPRAGLFARTVAEEVEYFPRNRGLDPAETAGRAMRDMQISELRNRNPLSLSHGEQRRVSIAAVLAGEPTAVALDEPTAGLGREDEERLGRLLTDLDATVVFSTHSADFVHRFADRVAIVADGRLESVGPARELLQRVELLEAVGIRPPGPVLWATARGLERPPPTVEQAATVAGDSE